MVAGGEEDGLVGVGGDEDWGDEVGHAARFLLLLLLLLVLFVEEGCWWTWRVVRGCTVVRFLVRRRKGLCSDNSAVSNVLIIKRSR